MRDFYIIIMCECVQVVLFFFFRRADDQQTNSHFSRGDSYNQPD